MPTIFPSSLPDPRDSLQLDVDKVIPNESHVVAEHLGRAVYPVRVKLTRRLTVQERKALRGFRPSWKVAESQDELILLDNLDSLTADAFALLRDVREVAVLGQRLRAQEESEDAAQAEKVSILNAAIEREKKLYLI